MVAVKKVIAATADQAVVANAAMKRVISVAAIDGVVVSIPQISGHHPGFERLGEAASATAKIESSSLLNLSVSFHEPDRCKQLMTRRARRFAGFSKILLT